MLSSKEVCELLKQKHPFVFVDRVLELENGKRILAVKNITANEVFLAGHFPDNPVFPGVLLIEAVAQTASILCMKSTGMEIDAENQFLAIGGVQRFQFMKAVRPGDSLYIDVEAVKVVPKGAIMKAEVKMGDTIIASGQMTFGVVQNE